MIQLINKDNVESASTNFPYGNIKDDSGLGDGTKVDKKSYADFHQFFARLFALCNLTSNNLPESATNGFQYIKSLDRHSKRQFHKNANKGGFNSF